MQEEFVELRHPAERLIEFRLSVELIKCQCMLDRLEVPADLVVPAGFDLAFHVRRTMKSLQNDKIRHRGNQFFLFLLVLKFLFPGTSGRKQRTDHPPVAVDYARNNRAVHLLPSLEM